MSNRFPYRLFLFLCLWLPAQGQEDPLARRQELREKWISLHGKSDPASVAEREAVLAEARSQSDALARPSLAAEIAALEAFILRETLVAGAQSQEAGMATEAQYQTLMTELLADGIDTAGMEILSATYIGRDGREFPFPILAGYENPSSPDYVLIPLARGSEFGARYRGSHFGEAMADLLAHNELARGELRYIDPDQRSEVTEKTSDRFDHLIDGLGIGTALVGMAVIVPMAIAGLTAIAPALIPGALGAMAKGFVMTHGGTLLGLGLATSLASLGIQIKYNTDRGMGEKEIDWAGLGFATAGTALMGLGKFATGLWTALGVAGAGFALDGAELSHGISRAREVYREQSPFLAPDQRLKLAMQLIIQSAVDAATRVLLNVDLLGGLWQGVKGALEFLTPHPLLATPTGPRLEVREVDLDRQVHRMSSQAPGGRRRENFTPDQISQILEHRAKNPKNRKKTDAEVASEVSLLVGREVAGSNVSSHLALLRKGVQEDLAANPGASDEEIGARLSVRWNREVTPAQVAYARSMKPRRTERLSGRQISQILEHRAKNPDKAHGEIASEVSPVAGREVTEKNVMSHLALLRKGVRGEEASNPGVSDEEIAARLSSLWNREVSPAQVVYARGAKQETREPLSGRQISQILEHRAKNPEKSHAEIASEVSSAIGREVIDSDVNFHLGLLRKRVRGEEASDPGASNEEIAARLGKRWKREVTPTQVAYAGDVKRRFSGSQISQILEHRAKNPDKRHGEIASEVSPAVGGDVREIDVRYHLAQLRKGIREEMAADPEASDEEIAARLSERWNRRVTRAQVHYARRGPRRVRREHIQALEEAAREAASRESDFSSLVAFYGSDLAVDIFLALRPDFEHIPIERIRGILARYLGEAYPVQGRYRPVDAAVIARHPGLATSERFQAAVDAVTRRDVLAHVHETYDPMGSETVLETIEGYLRARQQEAEEIGLAYVPESLEKAQVYYRAVYDEIAVPEGMRSHLRVGREYPDLNQRINIHELGRHNQLLITDRVGTGKSAAVILEKERSGVEVEVIAAPSNVIATWEGYLSDHPETGLYEAGRAPRVETIESLTRAESLDPVNPPDYILISHERLSEAGYVEALEPFVGERLVIDELDNLKNVQGGVRAQNAVELIKANQEAGGKVVGMTATPVPNKIQDVAISLILLHPDEFGDVPFNQLTRRITEGDINLREWLLPQMQAKDHVVASQVPPVEMERVGYELPPAERRIYEAIHENDELTGTEMLSAVRSAAIDPALVTDLIPGQGAKAERLSVELAESLSRVDRVAVFVNDRVDGVLRGEGHRMLDDVEIPEGVEVRIIDGTNRAERPAIQADLNRRDQRMVVFISGQTASVGVNYSGAQEVIHVNKPWHEDAQTQQVGRVLREGFEPVDGKLHHKVLVAENSVEAGIEEYAAAKKRAIEKRIYGAPLTEYEQAILRSDAEHPEAANPEVGAELAQHFLSTENRLRRMYEEARGLGEPRMREFLAEHGEAYAESYQSLGRFSYEHNAARVSSTIVTELSEGRPRVVIDAASGPSMLANHLPEGNSDQVFEVDLNRHHFPEPTGRQVRGSFLDLPFKNESADVVNLGLAWEQTSLAKSRGELERLELLAEANRVLVEGGNVVISTTHSLELRNEEGLSEALDWLGFRIVPELSGDATSGSSFRAHYLTLEKTGEPAAADLEELVEVMGDSYNSLKLKKSDQKPPTARRRIIESFHLGDRDYIIDLNEADRQAQRVEAETLHAGRSLIEEHGGIENIPLESLPAEYGRYFAGDRWHLFRNLPENQGLLHIDRPE